MEEVFGVPLVLQMEPDMTINPIGKVIKRLEEGDEHDLPDFYRAVARRSRVPDRPEMSREAEQDYDALLERMMPPTKKRGKVTATKLVECGHLLPLSIIRPTPKGFEDGLGRSRGGKKGAFRPTKSGDK